jgi:hypothetical protein
MRKKKRNVDRAFKLEVAGMVRNQGDLNAVSFLKFHGWCVGNLFCVLGL